MYGAIIGDIIGSRFEFHNIKTKEFELFTGRNSFTDDTVMTCAVAEAIMRCKASPALLTGTEVSGILQEIGRRHPSCGYGGRFIHWMFADSPEPYNSFGNGSAMRISAAGEIARDLDEARLLSGKVTAVTHNHPEGLKGAEAAACAIVLARQGKSREEIREFITDRYYDLSVSVNEYRERIIGHGDETCQVSMPQAFTCFFEAEDFEDTIRNCVSIGGDCDTTGAIAGALAEAYFGIPDELKKKAAEYLTPDLLDITMRFEAFREEYRLPSEIRQSEYNSGHTAYAAVSPGDSCSKGDSYANT